MGIDYAREKLLVAVHSLVSAQPLDKRLVNAVAGSLIRLTVEDIPTASRKDFQDLYHSLTKVAAKGDEGTIQATVSSMTVEEQENAADKIVELFYDVYNAE
ncbi:MAG: hypothetical protein PSY14_15870 [bacterium]|nr:hypothetical protein [bacterium]